MYRIRVKKPRTLRDRQTDERTDGDPATHVVRLKVLSHGSGALRCRAAPLSRRMRCRMHRIGLRRRVVRRGAAPHPV